MIPNFWNDHNLCYRFVLWECDPFTCITIWDLFDGLKRAQFGKGLIDKNLYPKYLGTWFNSQNGGSTWNSWERLPLTPTHFLGMYLHKSLCSTLQPFSWLDLEGSIVLSFILGTIFLSLIILTDHAPMLGSWDFPVFKKNVNAFIDDVMGLCLTPLDKSHPLGAKFAFYSIMVPWFYLFIIVTSNEGLWKIKKCHKMGDLNISYWSYWTWKVARKWILEINEYLQYSNN